MKPEKTQKLLKLLDEQIQNCTNCNLHENGRAKPYGTEESEYVMILEAPGKEEVEGNTPLVGKTGRIFGDIMAEYQLKREEFLIMNSVNCRSKKKNRNMTPSEYHRDCCRQGIRKYIKVFKPQKIILMGNPSVHTILGEGGISKLNGLLTEEKLFGININCVRSYHPSAMIYTKSREDDIRKSIKLLRS